LKRTSSINTRGMHLARLADSRPITAQEVSMKVHSAVLRITGLSVCALFLSASILSADSIVITGGALVVTDGALGRTG